MALAPPIAVGHPIAVAPPIVTVVGLIAVGHPTATVGDPVVDVARRRAAGATVGQAQAPHVVERHLALLGG